jgi:predicted nuclease of predicted toxin-antitoxin system
MKFLVDAHLPRRLAYQLRPCGNEAVHTLDLPRGNRTPDPELGGLSVRDHAIVVTKDADFVNTFTIQRVPYKLLLVSTGNITNAALETLVTQHMADITAAFVSHDFVELTHTMLIIHV